MKQVRTRDFIYSTDGLFFASTNYVHPDDRFISFLNDIYLTQMETGKKKVKDTEKLHLMKLTVT